VHFLVVLSVGVIDYEAEVTERGPCSSHTPISPRLPRFRLRPWRQLHIRSLRWLLSL